MTAEQQQNEQIRRDLSLLDRINANDPSALAELYDRHAAVLFSIIMRTLRDQKASEEVLQELFKSIWYNSDPFDRRLERPAVWLCKIARTMAVSKLQVLRSRSKLPDTEIENIHELFAADFGGSADHRAMISRQQEEILIALTSLSPDQKMMIEFSYFRGFTYANLAEHFKVSPETVKARMRTVISILRQKLRHHFT